MRILLVDDEKEFVATLAERLNMRGIDADWVTTSQEAVERVAAESFDLAVLDVKMPKIGGMELKKILEEKSPKLEFLFLTGYGSEAEFNAVSKELGQDHYLVKPVDIESLIAAMKAALEQSERGEP